MLKKSALLLTDNLNSNLSSAFCVLKLMTNHHDHIPIAILTKINTFFDAPDCSRLHGALSHKGLRECLQERAFAEWRFRSHYKHKDAASDLQ